MTRPPIIETDRLVLRLPREADAEAEIAFYEQERSHFVGGPMARDLVWRSFAGVLGHWAMRGFGMFAIEDKETGAYLGRTGPWFPEGWPEPEISWIITSAAAEGRGVAHEAAFAARAYAYRPKDARGLDTGGLGWSTAISLIDPENTRSNRLAQRMGAVHERDFQHVRYGRMGVWRHPSPGSLAGAA